MTDAAGDPGARKRLTPGAAANYPGDTLFARLARVVCAANCLPRKELYEAWETARRARRRLKGGRVVDLAAGHGLLAFCMVLIDDSSPSAMCVDTRKPASASTLATAIVEAWPRLAGRVTWVEGRLEDVEVTASDVVVSAHACGALTDRILDKAIAAGAAVCVLPCCQQVDPHHPLAGWLDPALAIDVDRAARLRAAGYDVRTQHIPVEITPKNRLMIARPHSTTARTSPTT
jgi:hypothetical protein